MWMLSALFPCLFVAVCLYLAYVFWKKGIDLFRDKRGPASARRHYVWLKRLLLGAAISLAIGINGIILHNVLSALSGTEEKVFFFVTLGGLWAFALSTIGGMVVYLDGRRSR